MARQLECNADDERLNDTRCTALAWRRGV